jgi:pyruvate dehydrogenase E2 component (dihydrolipoamide acetyltransferase)
VTDSQPTPVLPWRERTPRRTAGFFSPAARAVATERGVDLTQVRGTGANGRVTRDDVLAVASVQVTERVPFNRVQQRAGAALLASKRTSAHGYTVVLADYSAIDEVRRAQRERWRAEEGFSLTYLPFVARAVVDAIRTWPLVNATVGNDEAIVHRDVHLGIAVDLAHQGLVVPVVRNADTLRLRAIARGIDDIARRARGRQLRPDDVAGGTFTITNPGASGTYQSFPIINQPQVAILSTDGVAKRVMADDRGRLEIRTMGHLCLAFDARLVDPTYAGAFAVHVAELLGTRDWAAEC